jgi:hypothetical protein
MQDTFRANAYKDIKFYDWKLISDVKDNDFKPFVDRMIKASQSYFITGPGDCSKTT